MDTNTYRLYRDAKVLANLYFPRAGHPGQPECQQTSLRDFKIGQSAAKAGRALAANAGVFCMPLSTRNKPSGWSETPRALVFLGSFVALEYYTTLRHILLPLSLPLRCCGLVIAGFCASADNPPNRHKSGDIGQDVDQVFVATDAEVSSFFMIT